jgi:hypothetical protein
VGFAPGSPNAKLANVPLPPEATPASNGAVKVLPKVIGAACAAVVIPNAMIAARAKVHLIALMFPQSFCWFEREEDREGSGR